MIDPLGFFSSAGLGYGHPDVCIAVLDGAVDQSHSCFANANLSTLPTLSSVSMEGDDGGCVHGTHVASVIFGQPGSQVHGIAPRCRGLIVPIFARHKSHDGLFCSQLDLARAITQAAQYGANIINISAGQLTRTGDADPILADAITRCAEQGILIIAAAGNDGCECLHVPAAADTVLAVGAMDNNGRPLVASNFGARYKQQGLLAPGENILGAVPGGGTARRSGTSYATPVVTGFAALLASMQRELGNPLDMFAISNALLSAAHRCTASTDQDCKRFLTGSLNIPGSINVLFRGGLPVVSRLKIKPAAATSSLAGVVCSGAVDDEADVSLDHGSIFGASAADATIARTVVDSAGVVPSDSMGVGASDCGCGGGEHGCTCGKGECSCSTANAFEPTVVYVLGMLGYDFGSEARRDSISQAMPSDRNNPLDPKMLLDYLDANPFEASSIIWTLNLDATPIYALQPSGPFSEIGFQRLREFLKDQLEEGAELISIPGVIAGKVRLQSGQIVPLIIPVLRGMYSWATKPLIQGALGKRPEAAKAAEAFDILSTRLGDFLNRVYYDLRNLGITAEERALNYAATNALQVAEVLRSTTRDQLDLDRIAVKKSPICRQDSDCYDVELSFFNPNNTNVATRIYRFTVDVSDVVPVTVGAIRSWTRR